MCYWIITDIFKIVSKTSVKHVTIDDYLKLDLYSRVDVFNKKLTKRIDNGNLQVNSDVNSKFYFVMSDEDLSENLGVYYASGITPKDEEYGDMIVVGRPDDEEAVIDNYLNMNLIFDVGTNDKRRGTVVKISQLIGGRAISR